MEAVILLLVWGLLGGVGSWIATQKGRSGAEGFVLGVLLGPIGWIIEALLPQQTSHRPQTQHYRSPDYDDPVPTPAPARPKQPSAAPRKPKPLGEEWMPDMPEDFKP